MANRPVFMLESPPSTPLSPTYDRLPSISSDTMGDMDTGTNNAVPLVLEDDIKDAFCDPENPVVVQFPEVSAAAFKIKGGVERTPCNVSI